MANCDHSKLRSLSKEKVFLRCCICNEIISIDELSDNDELINKFNKLITENSELKEWIREIEILNDELQIENKAIKELLKLLLK